MEVLLTLNNGYILNSIGSNYTYVDVGYVRQYAQDRGFAALLPDTDVELEYLITRATDYIESSQHIYQGTRTDTAQTLNWPRTGVTCDGVSLAADEIPELLKKAQAQSVLEVIEQGDIQPTSTGRFVTKEKVDVVEVTYAEPSNVDGVVLNQLILSKVNGFLGCLLKSGVGSSRASLTSVRI